MEWKSEGKEGVNLPAGEIPTAVGQKITAVEFEIDDGERFF